MKYPVQIDFQSNGIAQVSRVFDTIEQRIAQGATIAERAAKKRVADEEKTNAQILRAKEKADAAQARAAERRADQWSQYQAKLTRERLRSLEKEKREELRLTQRTEAEKSRIEQREIKARERKATSALQREKSQREAFARSIGRGVTDTLGRVTSAVGALGAAAVSVAGGFSIGDAVSRGVRAKGTAADIANSAYMPGEVGPNGKLRSSQEVLDATNPVGIKYGLGQDDMLGGLQAFVGKTGDLDTGLKSMEKLAQLSRATGSNFKEVADAAGDMAQALEKDGVKATPEQIANMMNVIAGQGKKGAVEMRDMASQAAKLGAAASQIGGDNFQNLATVGAITQMARAKGGAASADEAATSAQRFVDDTIKGKDKFAAMGIKTMQGGQARDARSIIVETLQKTKGDAGKLHDLFGERGIRGIAGFASIYRQAGGGDKGTAAVQAKFDELIGAAMNESQVKEASSKRMQEADAKMAQASEQLRVQLQEKLLPEFVKLIPVVEKLTPVLLHGADAFVALVNYVSDNPFKSAIAGLGVIIAAAFTKEIAAAKLPELITKMVSGAGGGAPGAGVGQGAAAGGGGMLGAAAGMSVVAGVAIGADSIKGMLDAGDSVDDQGKKLAAMLSSGDASQAAQARSVISGAKERDTFGNRATGAIGGMLAMGGLGGVIKDVTGFDAAGARDRAIADAKIAKAADSLERFAKAADAATPGLSNPKDPKRNGPMGPGGSTQ